MRVSQILVFGILVLFCSVSCEKQLSIEENTPSEDLFVIAQWNIGHFSRGVYPDSSINGNDFDNKYKAYTSLISSISADFISVNEFSPIFGEDSDGKAKEAGSLLFNEYEFRYEGRQSRYSCNAVFSKTALTEVSEIDYQCNQTAQISHTSAIKATDYYLIESNIDIKGTPTKIVSTHLAFDNNDQSVVRNQVLEIIERYQSDNNVILCGDWNVPDINIFSLFHSAGYQLANHGSFGDFVTFGSNRIIDNIMIKGFPIKDVRIIKSNLSDHFPLIVTILLENQP